MPNNRGGGGWLPAFPAAAHSIIIASSRAKSLLRHVLPVLIVRIDRPTHHPQRMALFHHTTSTGLDELTFQCGCELAAASINYAHRALDSLPFSSSLSALLVPRLPKKARARFALRPLPPPNHPDSSAAGSAATPSVCGSAPAGVHFLPPTVRCGCIDDATRRRRRLSPAFAAAEWSLRSLAAAKSVLFAGARASLLHPAFPPPPLLYLPL